VFGLGSVAYWVDPARFCSLRKKLLFPWNDVTGGCDLPQNVRGYLMDPMVSSVTL